MRYAKVALPREYLNDIEIARDEHEPRQREDRPFRAQFIKKLAWARHQPSARERQLRGWVVFTNGEFVEERHGR